jgi:hypothetical protein
MCMPGTAASASPSTPPTCCVLTAPQVQAAISTAGQEAGGSSTPTAGGLRRAASSSQKLPVLAEGADVSLLYVRFRAAAEPSLKGEPGARLEGGREGGREGCCCGAPWVYNASHHRADCVLHEPPCHHMGQ